MLDGGALGIVAPDVRSAEEARAVVAAAKYPPLGSRGASGGAAASAVSHVSRPPRPTRPLDAATMVIVQFESWEAVEKAEEIVAVEGVDMVLIGTNDLLADLGLAGQFEHEKVREAYARTIAAAASTASTWASAGLSRARSWSPSSSRWAPATSRPARTWASCSPRPPSAPSRCATSLSERTKEAFGGKIMVGRIAALALGLVASFAGLAHAEVTEVRFSKQFGLGYLSMIVIESQKLVEKQAATAGLGDVKTVWMQHSGPNVQIDALLAGQVDFIGPGVPTLATIWDRTVGTPQEVRALTALQSMPYVLVHPQSEHQDDRRLHVERQDRPSRPCG